MTNKTAPASRDSHATSRERLHLITLVPTKMESTNVMMADVRSIVFIKPLN